MQGGCDSVMRARALTAPGGISPNPLSPYASWGGTLSFRLQGVRARWGGVVSHAPTLHRRVARQARAPLARAPPPPPCPCRLLPPPPAAHAHAAHAQVEALERAARAPRAHVKAQWAAARHAHALPASAGGRGACRIAWEACAAASSAGSCTPRAASPRCHPQQQLDARASTHLEVMNVTPRHLLRSSPEVGGWRGGSHAELPMQPQRQPQHALSSAHHS